MGTLVLPPTLGVSRIDLRSKRFFRTPALLRMFHWKQPELGSQAIVLEPVMLPIRVANRTGELCVLAAWLVLLPEERIRLPGNDSVGQGRLDPDGSDLRRQTR